VIADEKPISMFRLFRNLFLSAGFVLLTGFIPLNQNTEINFASRPLPFISINYFNILNGGENVASVISSKYQEWQLASLNISIELFSYAVKGYQYLASKNILHNTDIITIADLSKPSSQKRLFVINIKTGEVLFNTLVAHGKNSGKEYAKNFSNSESSFESSLGFYTTTDTYVGKNGYSLRLNGCEKGFNDKANRRAIVMHGADYVSESYIEQNGCLGRSHGCPAVPAALSKKIIDVIKNGSCLFVYSPSKKYLTHSAILNNRTVKF
jgi:L,D-transpeptidase catalytic domain